MFKIFFGLKMVWIWLITLESCLLKVELDPAQVLRSGLLNAIHALQSIPVSKSTLAEEAIYVEQEMINEAVGVEDQITAAYGGINVIKLGPRKKKNGKKNSIILCL